MAFSFRGCFANCFQVIVQILNAIVLGGGIAAIALIFVIRPNPTFPAGWGYIATGLITFLSGLFGCIFPGRFGCCGIHLLLHVLSLAGLAVCSIIAIARPGTMTAEFQPTITPAQAMDFVYVEGGIMLALFALQVLLGVLTCCAQSCGCLDRAYEDLDSNSEAKQAAKQQMEEEQRRSRVESTSAHSLAQKMKEKYGKFANPKSDFEMNK